VQGVTLGGQGERQVVTASGGNVYVGGTPSEGGNRGIIAMINPSTLQELRRENVDQRVVVVTNDETNVVAVGDKGKIWVLSADGLALQRTVTLSVKVEPRAALILGDDLYLSSGQQQGENGAALILSGWRPSPVPPPAPSGATDCPFEVVNVGGSETVWMYEDPDTQAPKVVAMPPNARGLVADRCIRDWCHVSFRGAAGWIERRRIKSACS